MRATKARPRSLAAKAPTSEKLTNTVETLPYQPTERECLALETCLARREQTSEMPTVSVQTNASGTTIMFDHPDQDVALMLLAKALGTSDVKFAWDLLCKLADAARQNGKMTTRETNYMLSVVNSIGPQDATEALLAVQMAAIHNAALVAARRLTHVDTIAGQDSASNMLNKLMRTFVAQVDALKKYRHGGEQTIKVQHVTVNEGGQAIVGNIREGVGGGGKIEGQSHEPSFSPSAGPPLLSKVEAHGKALRSAGGTAKESVPISRGPSRSAVGSG